MKDDVERELQELQEVIAQWERNRRPKDTDDDLPDSSVPAPVKPRPVEKVGGVALPEPDEDD